MYGDYQRLDICVQQCKNPIAFTANGIEKPEIVNLLSNCTDGQVTIRWEEKKML